jgi:hypothetical protein
LDSWSSASCGSCVEVGRPLRHDAFEAELARLGEHDRAVGGERFAEQDAADAGDEPLERLAPRLKGTQARRSFRLPVLGARRFRILIIG